MKRQRLRRPPRWRPEQTDLFFDDLMGVSAPPRPIGETTYAHREADQFLAALLGEPRRPVLTAAPAAEDAQESPEPECGKPRTWTDLPLLLAGPIVRRAEADGVWFWCACREEVTACTPRLTVYDASGRVDQSLASDGGFYPLAPPRWRVARLGEHLWVVLALARPRSGAFPRARIYGYDLDIETRVGSRRSLTKLSSLPLKITYRPFALPTFLFPKKSQRLAHGSCRRPGAHGDDAFPQFDEWLEARATDTSKRPSALILTGDQIYADDVASPLFKAVQNLARDVCGYVELLPRIGGASPVSVDAYLPVDVPQAINTRKALTALGRSPIGFTTVDGEAHLLSFPEYAAMYLLVWNEKLCRDYCVERGGDANLTGFSKAVEASRRVLANSVTYMVFDDHDITDDWNLDAEWEANTQNVMAKRIIANGLAAYWAFQGWGNDPDRFAFLADAIERHVDVMRTARGLPGAAASAFDSRLLAQHWSFVAPTTPPALCVDIRTRRETPTKDAAAVLSGPPVWRELAKLAERHRLPRGAPLLIVLPTPLLPHPSLMVAQSYKIRTKGKLVGDYEFYGNNPQQRADLVNFLHDLLDPPALIVFSGDVHHGSVIDGLYVRGRTRQAIDKGRGDWAMRIAQVTSSPIKNIKKDVFVDPIEVPNPFGGSPIRLIDKGTAGEKLVPMVGNTYHRLRDNSVMGTRAETLTLTGPLARARKTYVYENHLCVVDVPHTTDEGVWVTFVGVTNGRLAIAETKRRVESRPGLFQPPPRLEPLPLPLPPPAPRVLAEMLRGMAGFEG
jgi:hypothetical protein